MFINGFERFVLKSKPEKNIKQLTKQKKTPLIDLKKNPKLALSLFLIISDFRRLPRIHKIHK